MEGTFGDLAGRFKPSPCIPLLRGIIHGDRVRREGPCMGAAAVLLLLALRARGRAVRPEGRLRGAGGRRPGPPGPPAPDGRVPRAGGAGDRPPKGEDRTADREGAYLYLKVRPHHPPPPPPP